MQSYKNRIKTLFQHRITCAVARLFCLCFLLLQAQTSPLPEYKIKAVFLFNFTQFVEWPANTFSHDNDPFVIGIIGNDPFGRFINEAIAGEKLGTHPLTIVHYKNASEIYNCQMLFIGAESNDNLPAIFSALNNRPVLTISDVPGFTKAGGVIGFITTNNKIKIEININAAKAAGLNVSSKLLSVATISK